MHKSDRILRELNREQQAAVTFGKGPLLIVAGAGSGKTRVLTYRIAYLIAKGVPPFHFLAVTFTNKAAEEMRKRIKQLVNAEVWVSTFHASCLRILKREYKVAGLRPHFSVYDETDQLSLIKECLEELKLDDKQYNAKAIRERIDRAKDILVRPPEYAERALTYYDETVGKIYALYETKLRAYNALDFGGLILECIALFKNHPSILAAYQRRFQYILIDEYQDTNHAQYQWVNLLAEHHQNVTVVGDPDQSIYGWRGADITNILTFEHDYPNVTVITLEKNYRSTKNILDASNALIENNQARKEKTLWTDNTQGDLLFLCEVLDERREAQFLVEQIARLRQETACSLNDMVVFYRVHAQSRILEDYLRRYNIPYKIVGGVRFYDRREIKDMLAYLKVLVSPQDDIALRRILNVPPRGIGAQAERLLSEHQQAHSLSLYKALAQVKKISGLNARARTSMQTFYKMLEAWRIERTHMLPSELFERITHDTNYIRQLEKENTIEARSRIENIKELLGVITEFEESYKGQQKNLLESFLDMVSLQTNVDEWQQEVGTLTLMTIHCAKGLEFEVVFMVGMEEDIFPHVNVLENAERELEEERRLCYVGVTRAKQQVYLSFAQSRRLYGTRMRNLPSRFLGEIPAEYMTYIDAVVYDEPREQHHVDDMVEYDYS